MKLHCLYLVLMFCFFFFFCGKMKHILCISLGYCLVANTYFFDKLSI